MFSINYNLFCRRIQHDVCEKSTVHKLEKNAKNTLAVLKGKPVLFGPKNVFFHYIHSKRILINLAMFDDIE